MQTDPQCPAIPAGAPRLFLKESLYGTFDRVTGLPVAGVREGAPRYALVPSLFSNHITAAMCAESCAADIKVIRLDPTPFTPGWQYTVRRAVLELTSEVTS